MSRKRGKLRVFVDSSVLFAAVLSPTGGAFRIFREAHERHIELGVSPHVLTVERCLAFLPFGDAPIIAAAIKAKVNALVTLDQKHFLRNEKLAALKLPFSIMTPGDFIKEYFI